MEIFESLGDGQAVGRICAATSIDLLWSGRLEESLRGAQRGLASLGDRVNADRCVLLAAEVDILCWMSAADYLAAEATLAKAVKLAEGLNDQRALGLVLLHKADCALLMGRHAESFDDGLRSGRLLLQAGAPYEAVTVFQNALSCAVVLGRLDEGDEIVREIEQLVRFGNESSGQLAMGVRAQIILMRSGDIGTYADACHELLRAAIASNNAFNVAFFQIFVAGAELWQGRWDEAEEHLTQAGVDVPVILLLQAAYLLSLRALSGARAEALAIREQKRSDLPALGTPIDVGASSMLGAAIEALALLGCNDESAERYPNIREALAAGSVLNWQWSLLEKVAGIAAGCGQQWAVAEQHFDTALRQAHDLPHRIEQPEVRRWYASMLFDRDASGDRDRARELLNEAIAMYRDIGMPKHLEIAEALLATASGKAQ